MPDRKRGYVESAEQKLLFILFYLHNCPIQEVMGYLFLDGTDRPVRRPKDPDKQKDRYSGRKKRHTVKNLILTRERTATFLSSTRPGRESDKRLAEALQSVAFPKGSVLITDLGFEGLSIQNAALIQAAKKTQRRAIVFGPQAI